MQPMLILILPSLKLGLGLNPFRPAHTLKYKCLTEAWLHGHLGPSHTSFKAFFKLFHYTQNWTCSFATQVEDVNIEEERSHLWLEVTFLARGQSTLGKWCSKKGVMTISFPSNIERTTLSPKCSSRYVLLAAI